MIVNREVQVRRNQPTGLPERADIQVDASTTNPATPALTVPIEVKGAWHDELLTSITRQLADQYMADLHARHGLYLVIWPDIESWNTKDRRRTAVAARVRADVIEHLDETTRKLELEGHHVTVVHLDISYARPLA